MRDENTMLRYIEAEPDDIRRIVRDPGTLHRRVCEALFEPPRKAGLPERERFPPLGLRGGGHVHGKAAGRGSQQLAARRPQPPRALQRERRLPPGGDAPHLPGADRSDDGPRSKARASRGRRGSPVLCTTLSPGGALARECDIVIEKPTGFEESFPESRGHVASMVILLLCAVEAAARSGGWTRTNTARWMDGFERLPKAAAARPTPRRRGTPITAG